MEQHLEPSFKINTKDFRIETETIDAQEWLRSSIIGRNFLDDVSRFLEDVRQPKNSRLKNLEEICTIVCEDNSFIYDVLCYADSIESEVFVVDGRELINMFMDKKINKQNIIQTISKFRIVCVTNLHRVIKNKVTLDLVELVMRALSCNSRITKANLLLHTDSSKEMKDIFHGSEWAKKSHPILTLTSNYGLRPSSETSFESYVQNERPYLPDNKFILPVFLARSGIFSAIDTRERSRLTEVKGPDHNCDIERTIDIPIVRDFRIHNHYVNISGPICDVDNDMKTYLFILALFVKSPNVDGIIRTSWRELIRGHGEGKMGSTSLAAKRRSLSRLADVSIRVESITTNETFFHGHLLSEYSNLIKKGRGSCLEITLPKYLVKHLMLYKMLDITLLKMPPAALAMYTYIASQKEVFSMKNETWATILGRNYAGYKYTHYDLAKIIKTSLQQLEERNLITTGWKVTDATSGVRLARAS